MNPLDQPKKRRNHLPYRCMKQRLGTAALEEVMILAVIFPIVAACFFVGVKIFRAIYSVIAILVSWPGL